MHRIGAVSAVLEMIETLLHREEVERVFEGALQNAWFRMGGVSLEMFAL